MKQAPKALAVTGFTGDPQQVFPAQILRIRINRANLTGIAE
jgi:hypothetical protein